MSSGEFDLRGRLAGALPREAVVPQCSRAGCEVDAEARIEWRNPRIHSEDRIKIWLSCGDHKEYLLGFLQSRDFPVRVHDIHDPVNEAPIQ